MYKLGKAPARKGAVKLEFKKYVDLSKLPPIPKKFGHENLVKNWGMLGNDQYGDCVWAGAAHETMLWNAEAGVPIDFTDNSVLSDYSVVTGFNKNDENTDQGTDVQQAASYRLKTGVIDAHGNRHKIAAYLALTPGDIEEAKAAIYLFNVIGIGIQCPDNIEDQFNSNKPWSVTRGTTIDGGHYIPALAFDSKIHVITWGKVQLMNASFYKKYCDEVLAYVSYEQLKNGKNLEGFDANQLQNDLAVLAGKSV